MDDKRLEDLYNKCKSIGRLYSQEIGNDFPGWAIELIIKNNGNFKSIKLLLIDYFRSKFGRTYKSDEKNKSNKVRKILGGLRNGDGEIDTLPNDLHNKLVTDISCGVDYNSLLDLLPSTLRAYLVLKDKYGFTYEEVAFAFGVTEPYIFTECKKARKILSGIIKEGAFTLKKTN